MGGILAFVGRTLRRSAAVFNVAGIVLLALYLANPLELEPLDVILGRTD